MHAEGVDAGWTGQITPYLWGAGVEGDFRPLAATPTVSVDRSFSDLLEDLDFAFFATGLARKDRLVLLGDLSHSASSGDGTLPNGIPAEGELTQTSLTLAAGYRATTEPWGTIDLIAGARLWWLESQISLPVVGVTVSPDESFADPILGARINARLSESWTALTYLDIGGSGAGSDSTFQVSITFNYELTPNLYFSGGYRHLAIDYSKNGTEFDGSMRGPIGGVTWRFR